MRYAVDLHIHSCLSPCGDELMTPNNLTNMAAIKGLKMIAVADHNSARNLPAIDKVAKEAGVSLLPAMELTTLEEVHLLAYFKTVSEAVNFSETIYSYLPEIPNHSEIFGTQIQMDEEDEPVYEEQKLLISALTLSLDELVRMIHESGGAAVPAHINRGNNGILNALGFIPPGAGFQALEVTRGMKLPHTGLPGLPHLHSSDAHRLEDIFEATEFLDMDELSPDGFFRWLSGADLNN